MNRRHKPDEERAYHKKPKEITYTYNDDIEEWILKLNK